MRKKVERPYEKDKYFNKWLVGLSERTDSKVELCLRISGEHTYLSARCAVKKWVGEC